MQEISTGASISGRPRPRRRMYEILETSTGNDGISRVLDLTLIGLIVLSVIAVVLESIPEVEAAYAETFYWLEIVTVAVFSVEFFLRMWCAVENHDHRDLGKSALAIRARYFFSPYAVIDLLAVLPFYLAMVSSMGAVDMRLLRCVRLLRVLKLTRYSSAFDMLVATCKDNARSLTAAFFVLLMVMLLASMGMYLFERQAQPDAFRSIPDSMWWAVSTLTTVGYGDVTPVTPAGKIFGALITVIGVGMVALPTGILASGYALQTRLQSDRYQREAERALLDGVISAEELEKLEELRTNIAMSKHTATQILDEERARHPFTTTATHGNCCPRCGAAVMRETRT